MNQPAKQHAPSWGELVTHANRTLARFQAPSPTPARPQRAAQTAAAARPRGPRRFVDSGTARALRMLGALPPASADPIGDLAKFEGLRAAPPSASSVTTVEEPSTLAELIAAAPTGADGTPPNNQVAALWWLKAHVDATVEPAKPSAEALRKAAELVQRIKDREAQAAAPKLRAAVARRLGGGAAPASTPSGSIVRLADLPGSSQFDKARLFLTKIDPAGFGRLPVSRQVTVFRAELAKHGVAL